MALVLREKDVRLLLSMPDTVEVLEQAFAALAQNNALNRPRSRLVLASGVLHMLSAAAPSLGVLGFKAYTTFREGVRFVVMLFSAQNGQLLAIIEADWLGCMRTGGASGVATKYLARPEAKIVGLIGAGNQAVTQLMGVCAVRQISGVYVYARRPRECAIFCDEMTRLLNIDVKPVTTAQQAVEAADILVTATTSPDPVLRGEWLKSGCHINAIGSNWAQRRELDVSTLQLSSLIVTDSREQARTEAGDLIIPANEGLFDWNEVYNLSDVIVGYAPQRELPDDITLYKGVGIALEDIAAAEHVFRLAVSQNIGEGLDILA
jgi:alanine dehydrogenase